MLIKMGVASWVNVGNARTIEIGKSKWDGKTILVISWPGDFVDHEDYRPAEYRFESEDFVRVARAQLSG